MLDKKYYKESYSIEQTMKELGKKLASVQRQLQEHSIPLVITVEGWESSGKGSVIRDLIRELDQRYCHVKVLEDISKEEYPFQKALWAALPKYGQISILDRSVYSELFDHVEYPKSYIKQALEQVLRAQKTLWEDGMIFINLFLDISQKTQRHRIEKYARDPYQSLYITRRDLNQNICYEKYRPHYGEILRMAQKDYSPWIILSGEDKEQAGKKALKEVINILEEKIPQILEQKEKLAQIKEHKAITSPIIENLDLSKSLTKDEYKKKKKKLQKRAQELGLELKRRNRSAVIVFEGNDAAGKGGSIKRLTKHMDPRNTFVATTAKPTEEEYSYHYLHRFYEDFPRKGEVTVFDRSWYGRVMVERIEGFAKVAEWERAYDEMLAMEKELHDNGVIVIKYFLAISNEEQLARFQERENTPEKNYKITQEDWRNRDKWKDYLVAIDEMITRTNKEYAPWIVVEGNDKRYERVKVLETFVQAVEKALKEPENPRQLEWERENEQQE